MKLYHGTSLYAFKKILSDGNLRCFPGKWGKGVYFTNSKSLAEDYAMARSEDLASQPVILSVELKASFELVRRDESSGLEIWISREPVPVSEVKVEE